MLCIQHVSHRVYVSYTEFYTNSDKNFVVVNVSNSVLMLIVCVWLISCCSSTDAGDAGELDFSGLLKKR